MKETIKYYYNIDVETLDEKEGRYHFKYDDKDFFFVYYNRLDKELNDIILCINSLKRKNIFCHEIIPNIKNELLTKVNNYNYLLLMVTDPLKKYDLIDIDNFNKRLILNNYKGSLYRNNWSNLWSNKVDYFENQISKLGLDKKIITNSFSYYIGLAENAIAIVNVINKKYSNIKGDIVLSHRRVFYPNYKLNYLNPLSFVFDLRVRDIAEYLKSMFFNGDILDTFIELNAYLKIAKLNIYELNMLWARLLYPTYYFDLYEQVMNNNRTEDDLIKVIDKIDDYEKFLKKTYLELSKYGQIEKVSWLIN